MSGKYIRSLAVLALLATAVAGHAQVVISQVYGGGGNSGSTYKNDFIELLNTGNTTVDQSTSSVQYNSATGVAIWQATNLTGTIAPGHYYLI
jgi:predicted extracellular nuclease